MPYAGERVAVGGVYRSYHPFHREHDAESDFALGQVFPRCSQCKDVEYILIKAAAGSAGSPQQRSAPPKTGSSPPE